MYWFGNIDHIFQAVFLEKKHTQNVCLTLVSAIHIICIYRGTPKFMKVISSYNAKILNKSQEDQACNCTDGKWRAKNIISQAEVISEQVPPAVETYATNNNNSLIHV